MSVTGEQSTPATVMAVLELNPPPVMLSSEGDVVEHNVGRVYVGHPVAGTNSVDCSQSTELT